MPRYCILLMILALAAGCRSILPPKGGVLSSGPQGVTVEQGGAAETPTTFRQVSVVDEPVRLPDFEVPYLKTTTSSTEVEFGSAQDWSQVVKAAEKHRKPIVLAIFGLAALGAGAYLFFQGWRILGLTSAATGIAGLVFYQAPWVIPIGAVACVILYLVVQVVENRYLPASTPAPES